jgi:Cdc6-like AAA superfamily ATPase
MDLGDITGEVLAAADLGEVFFPQFCAQLLDHERKRRHKPSAEVRGPSKGKVADGGRDLIFVVDSSPTAARDEFSYPLTCDEVGETWYSCKTGHTWKQSIQRDLGFGAYNTWKKQAKRPGPRVKERPSNLLLDHLAGQGHLIFLIDEQTLDEGRFLDDVADCLRFWLEHGEREVPVALRSQLDLCDANRLANFVREHRPSLSSPIRTKLGAVDPLGFRDWERWTREISVGGQRKKVEFEWDTDREAIRAGIESGAHTQRILWIAGPPGVGKTQVVHEALRCQPEEIRHRVRYSDHPAQSIDAFGSAWLNNAGALVVVVDEIGRDDIDTVTRKFLAHASEGSQLILIGPEPCDERANMRLFRLLPLRDDACRRLVARELEEEPEDLQRGRVVLQLSEGYPLFALRLAQALATDHDALAQGMDESNRWEAACRVLAGPKVHYKDVQSWRDQADLRARCLLAVILVGHLDWERLSGAVEDALERALGMEWSRILDTARVCHECGLLRHSSAASRRRYVSPHNLVRIIINHFFTGPEELGPRLRKHLPECLDRLQEIAEHVHATDDVRRSLARDVLDEIEIRLQSSTSAALAYIDRVRDLDRVARQEPEATARVAAAVIERLSAAELEGARSVRPVLRFVFEHLLRRKISPAAFAGVEEALFRMALVEDEPWSNNATGLWSRIFATSLNMTHQPWRRRRDLLARRLRQGDSKSRVLALLGLAAAIQNDVIHLAQTYDDADLVDGPWQPVPPDELAAAKRDAWRLLLGLCLDEDPALAAEARRHVASLFYTAVTKRDLDEQMFALLIEQLPCWTVRQKHELGTQLTNIREDYLDETENRLDDALAGNLGALEQALRPGDFQERLIAWAGSEYSDLGSVGDAEHELAADALGQAEELLAMLDWLESDEAVRRWPFMRALGERDARRLLLPELERRASVPARVPRAPRLLAPYLHGWSMALDRDGVDAWLETHIGDPRFHAAMTMALSRMRISNRRLVWLEELIARGGAKPEWLRPLGHGSVAGASRDAVLSFVRLLDREPEYRATALRLAMTQLGESPSLVHDDHMAELVSMLLAHTAVQPLSIVAEREWARGAVLLIEAGRSDEVIDATLHRLAVMGREGSIQLAENVLRLLVNVGQAAHIWDRACERLTRDTPVGAVISYVLARIDLLSHLSAETVLAWIGCDEERAVEVAYLSDPRGRANMGEIERGLVQRFGAHSRVGEELARQVVGPGQRFLMHDDIKADEQQREHARAWAKDPDPEVRQWAEDVIERCTRSIDEKLVEQEFVRAYRRA